MIQRKPDSKESSTGGTVAALVLAEKAIDHSRRAPSREPATVKAMLPVRPRRGRGATPRLLQRRAGARRRAHGGGRPPLSVLNWLSNRCA